MSNLILIHGAWGGAWEFKEIADRLNQTGHSAQVIDLPGHGDDATPLSAVTQDAYVQAVVEAADAIDGPVVLVGHSLAGTVISQVAERVPTAIERLVYVAAVLPKDGETVLGLMQSDGDGELLPRLQFSADESYVTVEPSDVREIFLHDLREGEQREGYVRRFAMKQTTQPFTAPARLSEEAFGSVPKSYIRCSLDKILSPALQTRMISGTKVERVFTLESGHFPLLSVPKRLAEVISEAVEVSTSAL
ncbi:MAG: alpha/beta fold hydrolase [Planctomycetes bacterium]|nr:alpha/beta fold hydrolase [Planctomycetota bacterium]